MRNMKAAVFAAPGRIVGHEPVGVIDALGPGVTGYAIGQRVIVGAITPCGQLQRIGTIASGAARCDFRWKSQ